MTALAYILSQFPETHETFILREVQAMTQKLGTVLPIFSLKPCRDRVIHTEARSFLATTHYPALRPIVRALPSVFASAAARAGVREVVRAYRGQPRQQSKALATLLLAGAIIPTLRRLQIGHLHAHWATMPALAAYFIRRVTAIPYSITAHAWDIYADTTMLREKLGAAEFVVTCTATNCEALRALGAPADRIFLNYHGLDFQHLPAPLFDREHPELRIVAVGRLVEQKGFDDLISACHLLRQRNVPLHCRIIGDGPLAAQLRTAIAAYNLTDVVILRGTLPQNDVFQEYRHATVLCAPSVVASNGDRDGIPNVILEAMAQGLPVVAGNVSGIHEAVQPGQTGWLVQPKHAQALADALQEVHQCRVEAARRATAAYELVRRQFDVCVNTEALMHLLLRLPQTPAAA